MKCILFKCEWFNLVKFRVVDVNLRRRYNKFESFILASQADQVSFISYPHIKDSRITWFSAIKITPRDRIICGDDLFTTSICVNAVEVHEQQTDDILLIDLHNCEYEIFLPMRPITKIKTSLMKVMYNIVMIT